MKDLEDTELRRLDLTLLLVFEEAMASRKLSAAAKRLGLTQSAISHAIKRLRHIFDDELFIRTPHGVQPTPRALALRGPLTEAVRLISATIGSAAFDPMTTDRVFRIAAPDYETSLFAPLLAEAAEGGARFVFVNLVRQQAIHALEATEIDIALGYNWSNSAGCDSDALYDEDYLVVARRGHALLNGTLTLERYTAHRHALTSLDGAISGVVDQLLAARGLKRHVVVAVPYFLATLATVARSELIATVPRRMAILHAGLFGLECVPPPLPIRKFTVRATWNKRFASDQAHIWLRGRIANAAKALRGP